MGLSGEGGQLRYAMLVVILRTETHTHTQLHSNTLKHTLRRCVVRVYL